MSGGLVVDEVVWESTTTKGATRTTTVVASVTMRKTFIGWRVTIRFGPVVTTTWHLTHDGAASRYDLCQHHAVEAMQRFDARCGDRPAQPANGAAAP